MRYPVPPSDREGTWLHGASEGGGRDSLVVQNGEVFLRQLVVLQLAHLRLLGHR